MSQTHDKNSAALQDTTRPPDPDHVWPENWADLELAVLDVETTGLDAANDRIIEIGILRFVNGEVVDQYEQLIDPGCEVPQEVIDLTGIQPEQLVGMPRFEDVAHEVHDWLQGVGIVAYNLSFDKSFISNELQRCGLQWPEQAPTFDPLIFARQFFKNLGRKNLGRIAKELGIEAKEAHRATEDARVAGRVLFAFADRLPANLQDVQVLQAQWDMAQTQAMRWRRRSPSSDSIEDAFGEQAAGLGPGYIYGDEADPFRALYTSVPEAKEREY